MRPIPIPDEYLAAWKAEHPGCKRTVLGAPTGRLDDDNIANLEVVWHPARVGDLEGITAATSLWIPEGADLGRLTLGHPLEVTVLTAVHPPIIIEVGHAH